jgi:hypothetical protein
MRYYAYAALYFVAFYFTSFTFSTPIFCEELVSYSHPQGQSARDHFLRTLTCYLSDRVSGKFDHLCPINSDGSFDTRSLPPTAKEQLQAALVPDTKVFDLERLRSWANTWSYGLRGLRPQIETITDNLADFKRMSNFKSWPRRVVIRSVPKQKTRVIYRSLETSNIGVSVAETYDSTTGDLNAPLLETEVAVDRADGSANADFYSYNSAGQLSTTSKFPVGIRQVPGFCFGCHYSAATNTISR